jgi:DNA adenine methylase
MADFNNKFETKKNDWETPDDLFEEINKEFRFTLDAAADAENTKTTRFFSKEENSLTQDWGSNVVWLNPPYGDRANKLTDWIQKGLDAAKHGATVVMLIPARTNTNWFHNFCLKYGEVRFIRGRPRFKGCKHGLPWPLCLVIFRPKDESLKYIIPNSKGRIIMEDYKRLDSPLDYYGGKNWFLKYWPEYIPPHKVYAELCSGSGILLLAKPPCPIEILNDKDELVYNYFKVLRDPIKSRRLKELLELTQYSRQEYEECKKIQKESPDDVERARAWFVRVRQARQASPDAGWSRETKPGTRKLSSNVSRYLTGIDRIIPEICERLKLVQIENQSILKLLPAFDSSETFFPIDTPYVWSTRSHARYPVDMKNPEHLQLVSLLRKVKGMVLLFGRPNPIYQPLEQEGWLREDLREEDCVWLSPNLLAALGKAPPKVRKILDPPTISLLSSAPSILITQDNQRKKILRTSPCKSISRLAA